MKDRQEKQYELPSYYFYDLRFKNTDSSKTEIPPRDLEKSQRRENIAQVLNIRFKEKSLKQRLSLLNDEEPTVGSILNEGLFGFLPDETMLLDLYPQGDGLRPVDKNGHDPLWKNISVLLNLNRQGNVVNIFKIIEKISKHLEDETQIEKTKRTLDGNEHLITLGDARKIVDTKTWIKHDGINTDRANTIITAFKKIEE